MIGLELNFGKFETVPSSTQFRRMMESELPGFQMLLRQTLNCSVRP